MTSKTEMDALLHTIEGEFIPNDFISEIEARPAIWNHTDPMYTRQACKKAAWDSIIKKYHPDIETKPPSEQALIGSHYKRKWKSFRDSFARELSKIKSSTKPRKTKYVYFQQLSFLLCMKGVPSSNVDDVESYLFDPKSGHYDDDDDNIDNTFNNTNFIKSEPDFSLFEVQQPETTNNNSDISINNNNNNNNNTSNRVKRRKTTSPDVSNYVTDDEDEDKLFLLSLLSELRRVPSEMKLDVKCDLLNVFKHARGQYNNNNNDDDDDNTDQPINNPLNNNDSEMNNNTNNNINGNNTYHSFNGYNNNNNIYNHANGDDDDAFNTNNHPLTNNIDNNNFTHT